MPKQIFLVYLGVLLLEGKNNNKTKTIMFVLVGFATFVMAFWIWYKMRGVKKVLLEEQEARKEAKRKEQELAAGTGTGTGWTPPPDESRTDYLGQPLLPSNPGRAY